MPSGDVQPDLGVVGDNPIRFITRQIQPGIMSMVSQHGAVAAAYKIDYRTILELFNDSSGSGISMRWALQQYHILPPVSEGGRSCYDQNYLLMLQSWGFNV